MGLPSIGAYALPQASELPPSRASWRPSRARAALLIHDMQNYFVAAFAPGTSPISPAIENIATLAELCRSAGMPVFYSGQHGNQDPRDRGLQAQLWGPGMTSAAEHQDIVEALRPQPSDIVVTKHRYSAFQRTNLEPLLRARGRDQLIVCGVYAHLGCLLTTAEAFQRDFEPFLVADALGDFSRQQHDLAVRYVAASCGVAITTAAVQSELR